ncbi:GNAT family N-acetyltransferase [Gordonia sp. ABSL1-1]|uniref:GNAT family N-acetyltransferase n=1 Tax=Gordonia sp. ABSL1-1 TaxID=3053923 RepID=UPI002572C71B|nr:GNAT family N-acetyltransferase [Gordonia sp. ABSL1-1]MDL9936129.1 GNAT family N-acetyltransferase [Gordonia sp. ABSL1-1]
MADIAKVWISHSPAQERYEAVLASGDVTALDDVVVGYVDYVSEPYQVVLTHTVIREQYSGHGYAAELVRAVLEDIRANGKQVVPVCSYVQRFIERHPEYSDMAVAVPQ